MANKGRALVWDDFQGMGVQSRRGPIRDLSHYSGVMEFTKRLGSDLCFLEKNADTVVTSSIIYEGDNHWNGPVDTVFNLDSNPVCP